jgi:hypothetical protein
MYRFKDPNLKMSISLWRDHILACNSDPLWNEWNSGGEPFPQWTFKKTFIESVSGLFLLGTLLHTDAPNTARSQTIFNLNRKYKIYQTINH